MVSRLKGTSPNFAVARIPTARRLLHALGALLSGLVIGCTSTAAPADDRALSFKRLGSDVATLKLREVAAQAEVVDTFDPYYKAQKHFRALPIGPLLQKEFGEPEAALKERAFVLRASDGYAVPIAGSLLLDGDAYLAIDDVDVPGFAPIGPRQVSPAPAYLIWKGAEQADLESRPRPWQLVAVEIVDPATMYPHTVPDGEAAGSPAMLGFALFRERCGRCHAINQEGGHVGPDLNVPQSIVEYRPEAQIRAYIQNPGTFRYGAMPAHPDLREADLDHLIAYFRAMATRKHDPAQKGSP